jgi:hypothetical protein
MNKSRNFLSFFLRSTRLFFFSEKKKDRGIITFSFFGDAAKEGSSNISRAT